MKQVSTALTDWLEAISGKRVTHASLIQPLWSGYGECFRAVMEGFEAPVVVKAVVPPTAPAHPKGWNTPESHARKTRSFGVERRFYQHVQPALTTACYAPRLLFSDVSDSSILLVLEDLSALGYSREQLSATVDECKAPLRWLAAFHAKFLGKADPQFWDTGCYWHLATRDQEWLAMPDGPLKSHASQIDKKLAECSYQTLVHGDAKIANFCFDQSMTQCAAIDFQYTGRGPGVRDLAYFLGSALSDKDLLEATPACLDYYFSALHHALGKIGQAAIADDVVKQWRALYPFACADFQRFLTGWSPQHRKLNQALSIQSQLALARLDAE